MKVILPIIFILCFISCREKTSKHVKQYFIVSKENETICSVKSNLADTIYFENKNPDMKAEYSFCLLNTTENQEFQRIMGNFELKKPLESFNKSNGLSIVIIGSETDNFYNIDWSDKNGKDLLNFLREIQSKRQEKDVIANFWSLNNFSPLFQDGELINSLNSNGH